MERLNQYEIGISIYDILKSFFSSGSRFLLENFFSKKLKKECIALGSGSDALYLALQDIKKKKGIGEVIISNYSCKAIPRAVIAAGFKPVFVDINSSISMDLEQVKKAISSKTKTILAYHPWGFVHNLEIFELAKRKNLVVIEDCAQSFAKVKGKLVGNFGNYSFFSFRTGKLIHAGSGGMLCSKEKIKVKLGAYPLYLSLANILDLLGRKIENIPKIKAVFDHFFDKIKNYKIGNAEAFLALKQLEKIGDIVDKRRKNYELLTEIIRETNFEPIKFEKCLSAPMWFPFLTNDRDYCIKLFKKKGINATPYYAHVNSQVFPQYKCLGYKNSERTAKSIVNLPLHELLSKKDLNKIVAAIKYVNDKIYR